ncbi:uncharacterized protein LOC105261960 [Musca domestica]|uniref:Uncharacterized protein LOC105261960 n=1 Tax=Musca domestica TaxID=7370 RepID=A0A9J7D6P2_MUSDO|nr:uncharacterized protein LOC105261960 [Musca domestica]
MKVLIILVCGLAVSCGFNYNCLGEYFHTVYEECLFEHGGDTAFIANWQEFKPTDNENEKCFRACTMRKCGVLNREGTINDDVSVGLAHILSGGDVDKVAAIHQAVQACRGLMHYEKNVCHNGENWSRCVIEHCKHCGLVLNV